MSIDERLAVKEFPLPAIREINNVRHETSVSLGLGELKDFDVDQKVINSLIQSLQKGGVSYSANAGLPQLRKVIAENQSKVDGYGYSVDNIIVTIGVQNALYTTVKTLAENGAGRVLIPEINFGIYKKIPLLFDIEVVTYRLNSDFSINIENLESIIKKDDIIIINSPANPTGKVLSVNEAEEIADIFRQKLTEGYVISDEIYDKLIYDGEKQKSFSYYFDRTIVLNGISKSAASAGLRVGWIITRNNILAKAIISNNASIISCPPTANQYAAIPVVNGSTEQTIEEYNRILKTNRDWVISELKKNNIKSNIPKGSFYIFINISEFMKGTTKDFCVNIAKKEGGVVVIPGEAFGASGYVRISLASKDLKEGVRRLLKELFDRGRLY